jgi:hypothetical protein
MRWLILTLAVMIGAGNAAAQNRTFATVDQAVWNNTVISSAVSSGNPNFLTFTGSSLTLTIAGGTTPLLMYINGLIQVANSNLTLTATASTTQWVIAKQDTTNTNMVAADFVLTTNAPVYQSEPAPTCPANATTQTSYWYDQTTGLSNLCTANSGSYSASPAIILGYITSATNITSATHYQFRFVPNIMNKSVTQMSGLGGAYQVTLPDFQTNKFFTVASGSFTITLVPSTAQPENGQCILISNYGVGTVTIARSGQNINGGTTSLTLGAASATAPQSTVVCSDGTNYFTAAVAGATGAGGGNMSFTGTQVTNGVVTMTATTNTAQTAAAGFTFSSGALAVPTSVTVGSASSFNFQLAANGGMTGNVNFIGPASQPTAGAVQMDASGNITTSTALTNGTTATTQAAHSNDTKVATDAYVDGSTVNTVVDTGSTVTVSTTLAAEYHFNENATAATAITYNLPTAAAGKQFCVSDAYNGTAANTGQLSLQASAIGQFIIFTDGTLSANNGFVQSGGAAADAACVVGVDATHWMLYVQRGTWTKH